MSDISGSRIRNRRLHITFSALMVLTAVCLLTVPATAHPPSDISVSYQELSRTLVVTITHQVPNPQNHYIKEVLVAINGKTVNDSFYTSQPAPGTFTYTYPIETVTTDEIKVTATCSLAGSISRTLYNTGPIASTPLPDADLPATKASAGLFSLIGVGVAVFLAGRH
jgi:hypothetical protein